MSTRLRGFISAAMVALPIAAGVAQDKTSDFKWSDQIAAGRWVHVRNLNGQVKIGQASGDRVEVTAVKRWRRGNPDDVRIEAKKDGENIVVCAMWDDRDRCDDSGRGYGNYGNRNRSSRWNDWDRGDDVEVDFTVLIPKGTKIGVGAVNGEIIVTGATSDVDVSAVNGRVDVEAGPGPLHASTVNGSVRARLTAESVSSDLNFTTVNGSVIAELPPNFGADVGMTSVNGSLRSDYDISVRGRIDPRHLTAHVGAPGGPRITLTTVNGDIELRKR